MAKKIYDGKIPFNGATGAFQSYPQSTSRRKADVPEDAPYNYANYERVDPEWRDNYVFDATMRVTGTSRGRSAARFLLEDVESGARYEMFMTDMADLLNNSTVVNGEITSRWTFCKRGANYGVRTLEPALVEA